MAIYFHSVPYSYFSVKVFKFSQYRTHIGSTLTFVLFMMSCTAQWKPSDNDMWWFVCFGEKAPWLLCNNLERISGYIIRSNLSSVEWLNNSIFIEVIPYLYSWVYLRIRPRLSWHQQLHPPLSTYTVTFVLFIKPLTYNHLEVPSSIYKKCFICT